MTTERKPYPELIWKQVWSNINQIAPSTRTAYLEEHYSGKVPSYEDVEFHSADSVVAFQLLPDGTYSSLPYNGTEGGLIRIMEKGFLLVRPADRQLAGRRAKVESPVATAVQPTAVAGEDGQAVIPEALVADGPPPPPAPIEIPEGYESAGGMETVVPCPEEGCNMHPMSSGRYKRHLYTKHQLDITRKSANKYWKDESYSRSRTQVKKAESAG